MGHQNIAQETTVCFLFQTNMFFLLFHNLNFEFIAVTMATLALNGDKGLIFPNTMESLTKLSCLRASKIKPYP